MPFLFQRFLLVGPDTRLLPTTVDFPILVISETPVEEASHWSCPYIASPQDLRRAILWFKWCALSENLPRRTPGNASVLEKHLYRSYWGCAAIAAVHIGVPTMARDTKAPTPPPHYWLGENSLVIIRSRWWCGAMWMALTSFFSELGWRWVLFNVISTRSDLSWPSFILLRALRTWLGILTLTPGGSGCRLRGWVMVALLPRRALWNCHIAIHKAVVGCAIKSFIPSVMEVKSSASGWREQMSALRCQGHSWRKTHPSIWKVDWL